MGAWLATELSVGDWRYELSPQQRDEILAQAGDAIRVWNASSPREFSLTFPGAGDLLENTLDELENGIGFRLVSGFPLEKLSEAQAAALFVGLGSALGQPVSQTKTLDYVARVEDAGARAGMATTERGHRSKDALPFHSDRADLSVLLCIRDAKNGGNTSVVSSAAAFGHMQRTRPELLKLLCEPLPEDRRGEEREGEEPWTMLPIFSDVDGQFVCRYIRRFIEGSQRHGDAPRLTGDQRSALDFLDQTLAATGASASIRLKPGDLLFLNNHSVLHSRDNFEDSAEPERGRLLLRLWLASKKGRRLPDSFQDLFGRTEPGAYRGGVWP